MLGYALYAAPPPVRLRDASDDRPPAPLLGRCSTTSSAMDAFPLYSMLKSSTHPEYPYI